MPENQSESEIELLVEEIFIGLGAGIKGIWRIFKNVFISLLQRKSSEVDKIPTTPSSKIPPPPPLTKDDLL